MMVSRVKKIEIIIEMPNSTQKKENKEKIKGKNIKVLEEAKEVEGMEEIEWKEEGEGAEKK